MADQNLDWAIDGNELVLRVKLDASYGRTRAGRIGITKTGTLRLWDGNQLREDGLALNLSVWRDAGPDDPE